MKYLTCQRCGAHIDIDDDATPPQRTRAILKHHTSDTCEHSTRAGVLEDTDRIRHTT